MAAQREVLALLRADANGLNRGLSRSERKMKKFARRTSRDIKVTFKRSFASISQLVGIGGVAGIAAVGKQVFNFEKRLTRLGIAGRKTVGEIEGVKKEIFEVAKARGVDPGELLAGGEKFTELTGDLDRFTASLDSFAKTAAASGASTAELAEVAAIMADNFGVADDAIGGTFAVLTKQGKEGAVEMRQMGGILAKLSGQFLQFNKDGTEGVAELGSLLQVTRKGFSSAEEAGTGLAGLMTSLVRNASKLKKSGVNVFTKDDKGNKVLRNLSDIIFDIGKSDLMKDPEKLQKAMGRVEGFRALVTILREGRDRFDELANVQGASNELQKDFNTFIDSSAGKMAKVNARMKETFNRAIAKHLETIAGAMEKIAGLLDFIVDHPLLTTGAILAIKFGPGVAGLVGALTGGAGKGGVGTNLVNTGKAIGVGVAAVAGFKIGEVLDDKLGLSDKLAGVDDTKSRPVKKTRFDPEGAESKQQTRVDAAKRALKDAIAAENRQRQARLGSGKFSAAIAEGAGAESPELRLSRGLLKREQEKLASIRRGVESRKFAAEDASARRGRANELIAAARKQTAGIGFDRIAEQFGPQIRQRAEGLARMDPSGANRDIAIAELVRVLSELSTKLDRGLTVDLDASGARRQ